MHQNQLSFFEELLLRDTEAAREDKSRKLQNNFDDAVIEREKFSVIDYLRDLRFHIHKAKQLSWIINTYFERVIDLINRVYQITHPCTAAPAKPAATHPYAQALTALQEILSFLEHHYGKFMDVHLCMPIPHEITLKDTLVARFLSFKASVQAGAELMEIIETAFADFAEARESGKTSYYRAFYLLALITNLGKLAPATNAAIQQTLVALNFNCPAFIRHYILQLQDSPNMLAFALKELHQINVVPGLAFNPLYPTVKEQLNAWLSQEISFQESSLAGGTQPAAKDAAPGRKITTTLSVPQLGNMLKLFSDLGIIVHDNKTELLEAFAAMFRTEKTENISAGSLRKNFYNDDASVSRSVRDLLLTAVNKSKGII